MRREVERTIQRTRNRIKNFVAKDSKTGDYQEELAKYAKVYELDQEVNQGEKAPEPDEDDLEARTSQLSKLIKIAKEVFEIVKQ